MEFKLGRIGLLATEIQKMIIFDEESTPKAIVIIPQLGHLKL